MKDNFFELDHIVTVEAPEIIYEQEEKKNDIEADSITNLTTDDINMLIEEDNIDQILSEYNGLISKEVGIKQINENMNVAEYLQKYDVKTIIPFEKDIMLDDGYNIKGDSFILNKVVPYIINFGELDIINKFSSTYYNELTSKQNNFIGLMRS